MSADNVEALVAVNKRPVSVIIIACLYIVMGAIGFGYHFTEFVEHGFRYDVLWVELVRLLAVVCGAFMLRGHNWARWLAVAWMAYHVILSAFHAWSQLAIHCVFLLVIAWFLLRPEAARYFRQPHTCLPGG